MIAQTIRQNLNILVSAYRKETGKSVTSVSKEFYGRGDFLREFQAGRHTISVDRLDAMCRRFMDEWPEGAKLPPLRPIFMVRRKGT